MKRLPSRQVHLDFHTSEFIPDVGASFDPDKFAKTVSDACVNSMTVFARCHHGWLYYDSEKYPEAVHPNLINRDLMTEQVRALHRYGIKAPIYLTVQWDRRAAYAHPEWLIRRAYGSHEGGSFSEPGFYQSLCVNTGYVDYLKDITKEICMKLGDELDGFFFDIVGIRPCLCQRCRSEMQERGIDTSDNSKVREFAKFVLDRFKKDMTETVRSYKDDCTIFYNAGHVGPCTYSSSSAFTHFELESLPSGQWGYLHFPLTARYARGLGKDCVGMTGKFHTEWGDFHSLKNSAALEFECFRMLSLGFAASIGDQLEPCGALNPATYKLIGNVYKEFAQREKWARPSVPLTEAVVITPERSDAEFNIPDSIMGATQMLEELAIQFDIAGFEADLERYPLWILPDDLIVDDNFRKRADKYVERGGKVLACARGGQNACGRYPDSFGALSGGKRDIYPDFLVAEGELSEGLEEKNEYVIYLQGEALIPSSAQTVLSARAPYFKRSGEHFCSHRYTPSAKGEKYPAVLKNGNVILFSHPIFCQYRSNAPLWCKKLISNAMDIIGFERMIRHDGPSTMTISALLQPELRRINLHMLTYIPVRKSASIDIIEERTTVRNVTVRFNLPEKILSARIVPEDIPLEIKDSGITVPQIDGYAIVELSF